MKTKNQKAPIPCCPCRSILFSPWEIAIIQSSMASFIVGLKTEEVTDVYMDAFNRITNKLKKMEEMNTGGRWTKNKSLPSYSFNGDPKMIDYTDILYPSLRV